MQKETGEETSSPVDKFYNNIVKSGNEEEKSSDNESSDDQIKYDNYERSDKQKPTSFETCKKQSCE